MQLILTKLANSDSVHVGRSVGMFVLLERVYICAK